MKAIDFIEEKYIKHKVEKSIFNHINMLNNTLK